MIGTLHSLTVLLTVAMLALPVSADDGALSLVPANAATVGMVRLSDMRSSPLSSVLFQHTDRMTSEGEAEKFLRDAGLRPFDDVDTLVVATAPRTSLGSEAEILVIAEGRFQPQRLAAALVARGAIDKGGYLVFPQEAASADDDNGAVAFLSTSLAVAGSEPAVRGALEARAAGGSGFASRGALAMDLGRIDRNATAWALIDVPRAARLAKGARIETGKGQAGEALQVAMKSVSTVAVWAKDRGDLLELSATGLSGDEETLVLLEDTVRGALSALRLVAQNQIPELVAVLRRFEVDRGSGSITVEGSIPASIIQQLMAKQLASAAK